VFFLGLDVLLIHDASMDLGCHVQWQGDEVPLWRHMVWPRSSTYIKSSSKVIPALCERVMVVVVDSLAGPDSRATSQSGVCIVRMLVQPQREMLISMTATPSMNSWGLKRRMAVLAKASRNLPDWPTNQQDSVSQLYDSQSPGTEKYGH
jgi:hypothetical protein